MNIKKILFPIFLSIICGYVFGILVSKIYQNKTNEIFDNNKIYLIQTGAYSTKDSMQVNTNLNNYVYYNDQGLYKTVIAITKDMENVDQIKKIYNDDIIIKEYYLDNNYLNNSIKEYDSKLKEASSNEEINEIITKMLNFYKENNNIVLTSKS